MKNLLALTAFLAPLLLSAMDVKLGGRGEVTFGDTDLCLIPNVHAQNWRGSGAPANDAFKFPDAKKGTMAWKLAPRLAKAHGSSKLLGADDGTAKYDVTFVSEADQKPEAVTLTLSIPAAKYVGQAWTISDGEKTLKKGVVPAAFSPKKLHLGCAVGRSFSIRTPDGKTVAVTFAEPLSIMVQDSRKWGPNVSVRFGGKPSFGKGEKVVYRTTLSASEPLTASYAQPTVVKAGPEWSTLDYKKDILAGSALDFSGMGFRDAPAGKHGWLRNANGHFEFEKLPGKVQRFYGVNLCFGANYPTHEMADVLVTRLSRLGYNAIRIHHYERDLAKGMKEGLTPNPEMLDRLDYLFAKAVEAGFYFTTDLYVSRNVRWTEIGITDRGDGFIEQKNLYKALVTVWDPAFENFKAFARTFLTHVNPYTGRRYLDEPAMPLISLLNENQLTMGWNRGARELPEVNAWYQTWLAKRRAADPAFCPDAPADVKDVKSSYGPQGALMALFMADTERRSAARIVKFLRGELGSKALFTDANCGPHYAPMQFVREDCYDYVDDHFYVDHPHFLVTPWKLPARVGSVNPVQMPKLAPTRIAFTRKPNQPFCVTEWNFAGPGPFRGVGGIMTGAYSTLQDWSGLWRFAYSHSNADWGDGKGTPGYFNTVTDPIHQAGDRASILLFLRRDLEPLEKKVSLLVTAKDLCTTGGAAVTCAPDWARKTWTRQVSTTVSAEKVQPGTEVYPLGEVAHAEVPPFAQESGGAVRLDETRGTFVIDTPRTSGGFAPEGELACGAVSFRVEGAPATVWASALDDAPICRSKRLLVSHLTDAQADGNVYADAGKTVLLKFGKTPAMVRKGKAEVTLALDEPGKYAVWALETSGKRLAQVPAKVADGKLVFTADVAMLPAATMLYEVVR